MAALSRILSRDKFQTTRTAVIIYCYGCGSDEASIRYYYNNMNVSWSQEVVAGRINAARALVYA